MLHLVHEISNEIDITVICSSRDYDGKDLDVVTNRFISFLGIARVWYSKESTIFSWSMFIRKQSARLWYINGLYSFRFSILPLWLGKGAKIICPRGMLDPGSLNKKSRKKQLFLFFFKIICWRRAIIFHAASEIEAKNIQNIMGNNIETVRNLLGHDSIATTAIYLHADAAEGKSPLDKPMVQPLPDISALPARAQLLTK